MTEGPDFLSVDFGAVSLGTIFDNVKIMAPRDLHDCCHIARMTIHMDSHDRLCSWSNLLFYLRWIDTPCLGIHIYQDWPCTHENHYVSRHNQSEVRNDYFIAISYTQGHQTQMQCHRPIAAGNPMASTTIMTECFLKTNDILAEG